MKKKSTFAPPAIGGSALLVIFAVLCLTVFALLSLSTVLAEKRLSDASAEAVTAYYQADLAAEAIFARLRAGENVPEVTREGEHYGYTCSISQNQVLEVELRHTAEGWQVLRWQVAAQPQAISDDLKVWDGT